MNSDPFRDLRTRRLPPQVGQSPMKLCSCSACLISSPIALLVLVHDLQDVGEHVLGFLDHLGQCRGLPLAMSSMSCSRWAVILLSVTILACFSSALATAIPDWVGIRSLPDRILPVIELLDDVMPGRLSAKPELFHLLKQCTLRITAGR